MNRKKFIFSISAGAISLLPGPVQQVALAQKRERNNPNSIPAKAVVPACLTSIDENGKIDYDDFKRHISDIPVSYTHLTLPTTSRV